MQFQCGKYQLDLTSPKVMGIVNVTPDSFSDGGQHQTTALAVAHALKLVEEGADILDIGGESTRPGAAPVSLDEELARVIPVIEQLTNLVQVPLSIDTYKPEVMRAAIAAGIDIVNDVRALQATDALDIVANSRVGVCLMHMQGMPQTMQQDPYYDDVVTEVERFLLERIEAAHNAGIDSARIMIDPGFGFGKRTVHNIALLKALPRFSALGCPVLVGLSRKSILGQIIGADDPQARLHASLSASVVAVMKGARVVRVHDVKANVEALKVANTFLS